MKAYLDNSATTVCSKRAAEKMMALLTEEFGNPSAMHTMGVLAEQEVKDAAEKIAQTLKVSAKEIIFTSGGTESNNMAIIGAAMAAKRQGRHVITTSFEHASVSNTVKFLEEQDFETTFLPVDKNGKVDPEMLRAAIRPDTILVTIMHVNNEVGAVQDLETLGRVIKEANPKTLFHVDAIQSYGKFVIRPKRANIDLLSVSGHKIHGPKGTGFLYRKDKTKIRPLILGGGQQDGMRSGTENVPGIAGLAIAAEEAYANLEENVAHMYALKERLTKGLLALEDVAINGPMLGDGAPHIVNAAFRGVRSEVLLHSLEEKQVYISAGSACSSHKRAPSASLVSVGVEQKLLESSLRFSFCPETTEEEIDYCLECIGALLPQLRMYTRR